MMHSYIDLGNGQIQLPFGILGGVSSMERSANGVLQSVRLQEKNVIVTHAGDLYASYTETPRRKNKPSLQFYPSGLAKSVSLEEQQDVMTPIGELPAEFVTFYESGELHRIFPVDGQISGFWSEDDERGMNIPLSFDLGFTAFTAYLSSICFYKSGAIKSITLFPDVTISVQTAFGEFSVRHGISLYETGELQSFEPAVPVKVKTSIGEIIAYDTLSHGISADENSITLSKSGEIIGVKTIANRILVQPEKGGICWHKPVSLPHPCSDDLPYYQPLDIVFNEGTVTITDEEAHVYPLQTTHFTISPFSDGTPGCSPADCANCSLCGH